MTGAAVAPESLTSAVLKVFAVEAPAAEPIDYDGTLRVQTVTCAVFCSKA